MKKAYSYIRFSTPEQLKGDSLRRQLEASEAYAEQNNLQLDSSMRDLGVSGFRGKNRTEGALKSFLDLVESGDIEKGSVLILESLDRLSRDEIMASLNLFTSILSADIEIVTLADNQKYTKESINHIGQLIISLVVMARAHEESATKSKRLTAAWKSLRDKAYSEKKPMTARCPYWLYLADDRSKYELNNERAEIVRDIFRKAIKGKGKRVIAKELNAACVKPWGGAQFWHPSYISKILSNRSVFGEFQPCKKSDRKSIGEPISDYYPSVISFEDFAQAQASIKSRNHGGGRKGKTFSNLFTGACKCGECGSTARFLNKGKPPKGGRYLVCSNYHTQAGCSNSKHWRYEHFEPIALLLLHETVNWPEALGNRTSDKKLLEKELTSANQRLADIEKMVTRYSSLFDNSNDDEFTHASAKYKEVMLDEAAQKKVIVNIKEKLASFIPSATAEEDLHTALHMLTDSDKYEDNVLIETRTKVNAAMKKIGLTLYFYPNFVLYLVKNTGEKGIVVSNGNKLAHTHEIIDIADGLESVNKEIVEINRMISLARNKDFSFLSD